MWKCKIPRYFHFYFFNITVCSIRYMQPKLGCNVRKHVDPTGVLSFPASSLLYILSIVWLEILFWMFLFCVPFSETDFNYIFFSLSIIMFRYTAVKSSVMFWDTWYTGWLKKIFKILEVLNPNTFLNLTVYNVSTAP